jgi:hypothetical protein
MNITQAPKFKRIMRMKKKEIAAKIVRSRWIESGKVGRVINYSSKELLSASKIELAEILFWDEKI